MQLCTCSTLFLYISMPLFCTTTILSETSKNFFVARFLEETSYVSLFHFFFSLPLIFTLHWWPLALLILSPPLQSFHVVLLTKQMSPLFFFSLSFAGLPPTFSFSLSFSLALYSKFVDMTINLQGVSKVRSHCKLYFPQK